MKTKALHPTFNISGLPGYIEKIVIQNPGKQEMTFKPIKQDEISIIVESLQNGLFIIRIASGRDILNGSFVKE